MTMLRERVHTEHAAAPPGKTAAWMRLVPWVAQILVAGILAQTLYFKFTYAPETQVIFGDRGGRPAATAVGVMELLCVVLLLVPRTAALGALLSLVTMSGALLTHLTSLGIAIGDPTTGTSDGGFLFGLAVLAALGSAIVLAYRWFQLPYMAPYLRPAQREPYESDTRGRRAP